MAPLEEEFVSLVKNAPIISGARKDGDHKTQNTTPDQEQRTDIKNLTDSVFHIDVQMVTCVHGTWSGDDPTKASFIVFHCEITSLEDYVVKRVKLEWEFVNDDAAKGPLANPSIAERGPHILRLYDTSDVDFHDTFGVEAGLEGEVPVVKPGLKLNWGRDKDYKKQYFAEASSGKQHASNKDHRYTRVWWVYKQNEQKKDGVSPGFRIAVLLKRDNDSPFKGLFTISEFDAGWKYKLGQAWNEFCGKIEEDIVDPVNFNPTLPRLGGKDIDKANLSTLAIKEGIGREHAWIWGVDLGK